LTRVLVAAIAAIILGSLPTRRLAAVLGRALRAEWVEAIRISLDLVTGFVVVSVVAPAGAWSEALVATAMVAGHQWPVAGTDRGRRGTAVAVGVLTAITPIAAPLWAVLWGLGFVISGYVTVGYVVAAALLPVAVGLTAGWPIALMGLPSCALLYERLREPLREVLFGLARKHDWRGEA
jgi:glycerol-3-phosphate acyltransferase PlsY